jgi:uncharacterized protein YlxW (UPF0749 family)
MTNQPTSPDDRPPEDQATGPQAATSADVVAVADTSADDAQADDAPADAEPADDAPADAEPADDAPADAEPADAEPAVGAPPPRRLSVAGAVVAVLLFLLGFTMVVQMRSVATDPTLAAARQEDLVRILADLDAHEERLRSDIAELEETWRRLTTAGQAQEEALAEATRRADELGILAGTLPVEGPGLVVEIRSGVQGLSAAILLDAVQELRGAGAEAMQITDRDGTAVRVVASTYFLDHDRGIVVDGVLLRSPYTMTVIGEPQTLQPALSLPGGVVETVHSQGGTVDMQDEPDGVLVSAVRSPTTLQHARPVS